MYNKFRKLNYNKKRGQVCSPKGKVKSPQHHLPKETANMSKEFIQLNEEIIKELYVDKPAPVTSGKQALHIALWSAIIRVSQVHCSTCVFVSC